MTDPVDDLPVCRVEDNALDTGTIPIVFVPGVMGSRLSFPSIGQFWDPDSKWRMWHWVRISPERARDELDADVDGEVIATNDDLTTAQQERGWSGVAWGFYGAFVQALDRQRFGRYETPIYVVGYDWRQSNRTSGNALATRIAEILEPEGVDRFIMISHSMGGLVTRSCLKEHSDIRDKCLGIIHIAQPVHGGVVLVRRMFTGAQMSHDGGYNAQSAAFTRILGNTRRKALTIACGMPGPLQLLVTHNYPGTWYTGRTFENPELGRRPWTGRIWDQYQEVASPPGLLPPTGQPYSPDAETRRTFGRNLRRSAAFHTRLNLWMHADKTWSIYGTGLNVDTSVPFDLPPLQTRMQVLPGGGYGGPPVIIHYGRRADGSEAIVSETNPEGRGLVITQTPQSDGTVPVPSAQGLFPGEAHPVVVGSDYNVRHQFEINDPTHASAAHDAICHHPQCERATFDIVRHLLGI